MGKGAEIGILIVLAVLVLVSVILLHDVSKKLKIGTDENQKSATKYITDARNIGIFFIVLAAISGFAYIFFLSNSKWVKYILTFLLLAFFITEAVLLILAADKLKKGKDYDANRSHYTTVLWIGLISLVFALAMVFYFLYHLFTRNRGKKEVVSPEEVAAKNLESAVLFQKIRQLETK